MAYMAVVLFSGVGGLKQRRVGQWVGLFESHNNRLWYLVWARNSMVARIPNLWRENEWDDQSLQDIWASDTNSRINGLKTNIYGT